MGRYIINRSQHSRVLDVSSFGGGGCDSGHCLVVAEVWKKVLVMSSVNLDVDNCIWNNCLSNGRNHYYTYLEEE
jgi:hypothetical protein